jgi:hypothetical protein
LRIRKILFSEWADAPFPVHLDRAQVHKSADTLQGSGSSQPFCPVEVDPAKLPQRVFGIVGHDMDPRRQMNNRRYSLKHMPYFILWRSIVQHRPFTILGSRATALRQIRPIPHCASNDQPGRMNPAAQRRSHKPVCPCYYHFGHACPDYQR